VDVDSTGHASSAAAAPGVVDASFAASAVHGSATLGDSGTLGFSAVPVVSGTIAGLYEGTGTCGKIGLIVTQASQADAPSAQGACIGTGLNPSVAQVNPLLPLARASDGTIEVTVGNDPPVAVQAALAPAE